MPFDGLKNCLSFIMTSQANLKMRKNAGYLELQATKLQNLVANDKSDLS